MGKFVMKTNEKGSRFVLKAGNGEIIGISETYSNESACKNGIESVRKSAVAAGLEDQTVEGSKCKNPKFEVYKDKAGEFRFRLKASNGEIILTGESRRTPDLNELLKRAQPYFFHVELRDETTLSQDLWARAEEDSLTGLFLREMRGRLEAASEEDRPSILLAARFGLAALEGGEDVGL